MNKDGDFVFQGVKSFLGACRASRCIGLALWSGSSQTYPSLARHFLMLLLVTVTSADMDTYSYNSNLEFGLRVFNCYSC